MPPTSERHPRPRAIPQCTSRARLAAAAAALIASSALPGLARAWGSTMDPVFVYYPQSFCDGKRIELEVWRRDEQRWVVHPRHPVVELDSCQLEDAGVLLNEIRWRCLDRDGFGRDAGWRVGVRVFEPGVMQRCDVNRTGSGFGETEIHVSTPKPGETISDADGNLEIEGSVWIGGLAGTEYDIVIAIDTSAEESQKADEFPLADATRARPQSSDFDPLVAQVQAARTFVDSIRDRLGEVRVGIVSFPGTGTPSAQERDRSGSAASSDDSGLQYAIRELPLSDDSVAIRHALDRVLFRGRAGPMGFSDGLSLAVDELLRPSDWPGAARPGARRLVLLAADGTRGLPFGTGAQADREFRERSVERARSASQRGVALHLFALGGISEAPPAFIGEMLANPASSFARVPSPERGTFFADQVSLPYLVSVTVHDAATGQPIGNTTAATDGHFAASVPLEPGENRLTVRARTSDGREIESPIAVEFDASAYRDRLLAREAARMRRAQAKQLELEIVD